VDFTADAPRDAKRLEKLGYGGFPVCVAKTQYSFTDSRKKTGAPSGFRINVRGLKPLAGAGFIVALAGDMTTMPGLPKNPAAIGVDIDENDQITGLF
jgi:formate--tetrahydrofolate ligase